ncbi:PREDICTED: probable G-protein coupled receptor 179 [Nipponia nippon]|uniref:probable G-protein coupled receptor 179 n=1 Tax=Nipponia nippon TaxID=128390 RepID=UPI00051167FC|nr:PREDICTED: probable G-protein coupled receptor 179 [Nipponia nippon]
MGPWWWPLLWYLHVALVHGTVLAEGQRPQGRPPQPAGWSPAPSSSWAPTLEPGASGDPEGSAAALAFLQTGDAQRLARANCSRGVAAGAPSPGPPPVLRAALRAAPEALAHAANFLNMLFQTNDIREASVAEDVEWYQALVRSLAEGHPWVRRAVLALDAHPLAAKPRLMLQATKGDDEILLQDISAAAPSLGNLSWDNEWFNALKSQRSPLLQKRLLSNDLRSMETPKWQRGDSYVGEPGHVRWSPPFLECRDGRFLPAWAVTLSSAFYGLKPDLSPEFKGVVRVDIELRDVAIDQCASGPGWFTDTHHCDLNSTQCVPQESRGFVLGRYLCLCKPGFYGASGVAGGARAGGCRAWPWGPPGAAGGSRLACQPCRQGCATCEDDAPCLIQEDRVLRAAILSCQACCMLAVFLSMLISYHFRRSKRIQASGVILLETILFGSLLLYFPVFILYFKPSIFRCIVLRWVRMLGFAIVYGTITLKLYRVLKVFLSRTAQRVPYVSSGRVLKMLGLILLLVLWFLAAWTIGMLENVDKNIPLVIRTQTARGLHFYICGHDRWDYMMVIAEMLFLLWGSFLCYATRAVPSAFHEPRYMGIALHNELMISAAFHVVRFIVVPSLHPDWTLLLFFAHTHGTVTTTLALLFIPKFLHAGSPLREEIAAEVYEDELDMRRSGSCLNSSIASAWSEHSLDPDDIREELKKLYTQLEVHKTWRMAANNPHLPKKRSSRRSLGRSIMRRVAELPEAAARRRSRGERVGTPARRGSSAKRLPDASGASLRMRDDGSRRRTAALRKSRSTEGPVREPRGGSPRKMMAVTASEHSDSESLDAAPLVCKSASAHNLAGHGQSPLPHTAPLQKSLSIVAGAREEALLAASRAARETWHTHRHLSAPSSERPTGQGPPKEAGKPQSPGAADALPPAGSSPTEGCSQEDTSPPGDGKVQKHVTYAPIKSISVDSSHIPGRVCPWELVQEEILSQKQKATKAADSGTPGDAAATPPSLKPPSQKTSLRGLGLAIKAFNRSRGKSILKRRREGEGSLRKRGCEQEGGSRRERPSLAETSAMSLGGIGRDPATKSPVWSSQRLGSEAAACPGQGQMVPCQHNNNAGTAWEATGWGYGRGEAEGQRDSPALGTGNREKLAEEPSAPRGDVDAGEGPGPPSGVHEVPPSVGHQEGAEHPHEVSAVPSSGKAQTRPWQGAEAPMVEPGKDAPAAIVRLITPKQGVAGPAEGLEAGSRSTRPQDHADMEQPSEKGASLRREGMASREDSGVPPGGQSLAKVLEKGGSEPKPLGPGGSLGAKRVPAKSWSMEVAPAAAGKAGSTAGRQAEVCPGETQADSSIKIEICPWEESGGKRWEPGRALGKGGSEGDPGCPREEPGMEKPPAKTPELPKVASETAGSTEGRTAEVCPWETGEGGSSARAEICPWDEEGAQPEQERREGERRQLAKWVKSIRPKPLGLLRAQESGSSLQAPSRPWGSTGSEGPWPKPAPRSSELPEVTSRSPASARASVCPWEAARADSNTEEVCPWERGTALSDAGKLDDGEISQVKNGISPWRGAPRGTGEMAPAADKGSSQRGSPSPGEGAEQSGTGLSAKHPALPKTSPKQAGTIDSKKADICPWEVEDEPLPKTQICPWEEPAAPSEKERPSQDTRGTSKGENKPGSGGLEDIKAKLAEMGGHRPEHRDTGIFAKLIRKSLESSKAESKKTQSEQSIKEEICPWESLGTEQSAEQAGARSPALPKSPSRKSQSMGSLKAEVCPWELESTNKAEICPWEAAAPPSGKEKSRQDKSALSVVSKSPSAAQGLCKEIGDSTSGKEERASRDHESICPWESTDTEGPSMGYGTRSTELLKATAEKSESVGSTKAEICPWESLGTEQPPAKPHTGSPALPKSPSRKSQSGESLKAEVCPWEAPEVEAGGKAEICPWEVAAPPSGKEKSRQDKGALSIVSKSPSAAQGLCKEIGDSTSGKKERASRDRESICPWESTDTEGPSMGYGTRSTELLKATAEKLESVGSTKAEICPWESLGTEQPPAKPHTGSPALSKSPSRKPQSVGSLKAEVCPWEAPEVEATDKAEICPWEVAAPPSGKEKSRQDKGALSIVSKSPSAAQGLCKEIGDSTSGKKERASRDRESICPWESTDTEGPSMGYGTRSTELLKATAEKLESVGSTKAEICPWESLGTEQPPAKPHTGSPALSKSPSRKPQSVGSLKAEVCPWEAPEVEATDKAEICPWEVAAPPSDQPTAKQGPGAGSKGDKRIRRQAALAIPARSLEKGSSEREAVCPWESLGTEQPPAKPHTGSPALPKSPLRKRQSVGSLKAEVCPWELESTDKAEICPWEATAPLPEKAAAPGKASLPPKKAGASKALEKRSSKCEAICPWESLGTEETFLKTAMGKQPSKKSDSTESKKSDICPWEGAEPTGLEKESFRPGMHPQGADRASPTGMGRSKPVAGASAVSPTALLNKSKGRFDGEAEHKPLCRILPGIQPPRGPRAEPLPRGASMAPAAGGSPSPGASTAEVPGPAQGPLGPSRAPEYIKTPVVPASLASIDTADTKLQLARDTLPQALRQLNILRLHGEASASSTARNGLPGTPKYAVLQPQQAGRSEDPAASSPS